MKLKTLKYDEFSLDIWVTTVQLMLQSKKWEHRLGAGEVALKMIEKTKDSYPGIVAKIAS